MFHARAYPETTGCARVKNVRAAHSPRMAAHGNMSTPPSTLIIRHLQMCRLGIFGFNRPHLSPFRRYTIFYVCNLGSYRRERKMLAARRGLEPRMAKKTIEL